MTRALSEETLQEIDDMLDDIGSHRDVSAESVTRAVKVLLQEVRRQREELRDEQQGSPIDERLPVDQPLANQQGAAGDLADLTHPTRPPF